ncbi:hypothetical protein [Qipengyuania thermophila]|uniref:hypothetical protein n=1 Tax=Qipengyuania thermophila TaxID=2509361 RepID=UPI0018F87038|nr:hypothetical protein [Qipengyuania thermophila]
MRDVFLFNAWSLAVILLGTAGATALRVGRGEWWPLVSAMRAAWRSRHRLVMTRAALAPWVVAARRGRLDQPPRGRLPDRDLATALDALARQRCLNCMAGAAARLSRRRLRNAGIAARILTDAAACAPVMGLAAAVLAQARFGGVAPAAALAGAALCVGSGFALAQLGLIPAARGLERRTRNTEVQRRAVLQWLTVQLEDTFPMQPCARVQARPARGPAARRPCPAF